MIFIPRLSRSFWFWASDLKGDAIKETLGTPEGTMGAIGGGTIAWGGDVWVAAGTYNERISLKYRAYVYGGFGGSDHGLPGAGHSKVESGKTVAYVVPVGAESTDEVVIPIW